MDYLNIIIIAIVVLILFPIILGGFSIAPWIPTRVKDLARVDKLADLQPGQIFVELGCGNGRVCHYIATKNPEAQIIGVELSYMFYFLAKLKSLIFPRKNLTIKLKNLFNEDLSGADVIYVFALSKPLNKKLVNKFEKELKKEARVISCAFAIKKWENKLITQDKPSKDKLSIWIYEY